MKTLMIKDLCITEELDRSACRQLERRGAANTVLVVRPGLKRNALHEAGVMHGELGDANRIQPR